MIREISLVIYQEIIILEEFNFYIISSTYGIINHKKFYEKINKNVAIVPHFLIMRDGEIIELNKNSNIILLEDYGPLIKNIENKYTDYLSTIYNNDTNNIVNINWRGYDSWVEITDKQIDSLKTLIADKNIIFNDDINKISPLPNPTLKLKLYG